MPSVSRWTLITQLPAATHILQLSIQYAFFPFPKSTETQKNNKYTKEEKIYYECNARKLHIRLIYCVHNWKCTLGILATSIFVVDSYIYILLDLLRGQVLWLMRSRAASATDGALPVNRMVWLGRFVE